MARDLVPDRRRQERPTLSGGQREEREDLPTLRVDPADFRSSRPPGPVPHLAVDPGHADDETGSTRACGGSRMLR